MSKYCQNDSLGTALNIKDYVQETGRAGRDGEKAEALLFEGKTGQHASAMMKTYSSNTTVCRRKLLFQGFLKYNESEIDAIVKCKCCDVCACTCKCAKCYSESSHSN